MTNRVNPPRQLELPAEVKQNPSLKRAFDDRDFILFQLWQRVGAGFDLPEANAQGLYEFDEINKHDAAEQLRKVFTPVTEDYTTVGGEYIIVGQAAIVTLNPSPRDREPTTIKMLADTTVNAGGKLLDKQEFIRFHFDDFELPPTIDIVYMAELDEWIIE